MGVFDSLGTIINGYFNDFSNETARRLKSSGDPDLDAAYEELDDYLNHKERPPEKETKQYSWASKPWGIKLPPEELRPDFDLLGVPFGADSEACKTAYKKLLKIHHPDRHAGHEGNYKKATEKSAKINAAWDRIEKWRQSNL